MTLAEYQARAISTDIFSGHARITDPAFVIKVLGLVGEAGEVAEKFKKLLRDKNGELSETDKAEITKEIGDVLWYVSSLAHYMGVSLDEVAQVNLDKLASRKERGHLKGNGDNR